jgi:hypothetical protein
MSRKVAISRFKFMLVKLRSTAPGTAEHVAAEANVQAYRWRLFSLGLSEAEIAELIRG